MTPLASCQETLRALSLAQASSIGQDRREPQHRVPLEHEMRSIER